MIGFSTMPSIPENFLSLIQSQIFWYLFRIQVECRWKINLSYHIINVLNSFIKCREQTPTKPC